MTNVSQWNVLDASNNGAPPGGAPEGQAPSTINDNLRAMMGALARFYSDTDGTLTTAGTSTAYTLTTNNVHLSLADQSVLVFRIHVANGTNPTLNVDSLGARSLVVSNGFVCPVGTLLINSLVCVAWHNAQNRYHLIGGYIPATTHGGTGATTTAAARTNLGLELGVDAQAWDADLDAIAALAKTNNNLIVANGTIWVAQAGDEFVEDIVGAMTTGNTETGIVVTYQDGDGTIDFVIDISGLTGMTVAPIGTDGFLIDDGGIMKRMSYNQFRIPSVDDANAHSFATADVGILRAYTGAGGHNWTMNSGIAHDEAPILVINRGTGNMTLVSGTATLETAGLGLVMPPKSMAMLIRESSTLWQVGGTGLIA